MKSFRTPRYLERYEDVVFDLENRLEINPNDTQHQNRDGLKIVADNSGETTPFDWYNARLSVNFKIDKLADHAAIALNDNIGTVNGSFSLIKKIQVRAEGREVYDCDYANHCVKIPQQRPLTQIKHNSLFGTERSLLLAQKVNNSQRYA